MSENEEELARSVDEALSDAMTEEIAKQVASYYMALIQSGVNADHALQLTSQWQLLIMSSGAA